jgi:predicted metal-dependent hydrolase
VTDAEFIRALERCEITAADFNHAAHVRAAYVYLRESAFAEALLRIRESIRRYAAHLGKPNLYHETITVAYVALIQQQMRERGDSGAWPAFAADNAVLLQPNLLRYFYTSEQLNSGLAREIFLLPAAAGRTA